MERQPWPIRPKLHPPMAEPGVSTIERALGRFLRLFARVEPEEVLDTLVMTLTVFTLLCAYYLLKVAREPLILLERGGAEVKSYSAAGQAVLLVFFVSAYGALAKRMGRMKLLTSVYLFFVSNLLVFALLVSQNFAIGIPFYLWVGVYNYTSIAQFWALAADIFNREQGTRLFAVLGVGSSLGAMLGSQIARLLGVYGPAALMLGAAALLLVCVGSMIWVERRARRLLAVGARVRQVEAADEQGLANESAFSLLLHDRYLLLLAAITLLTNWINSNGEYLLDRTLLAYVHSGAVTESPKLFITQFKASYFWWFNVIGVVVQLFAVSRIMTRFGVRFALYVLPAVAFIGYASVLAFPVLAVVRLAKIAENSADYSIENTARQALYLVTSRVEKYVGKTAVDTFFVRLGDVFSALLVFTGEKLAFSSGTFAAVNLCLIGLSVVVVFYIGREHQRRSGAVPAPATAELEAATS